MSRIPSQGEAMFAFQAKAARLPEPKTEYRFSPDRRWRLDFAWPAHRIALEVEGGAWINGRHSRGKGFSEDCEKYAHAAIDGWTVIRATTEQIRLGMALNWITAAFHGKQSALRVLTPAPAQIPSAPQEPINEGARDYHCAQESTAKPRGRNARKP